MAPGGVEPPRRERRGRCRLLAAVAAAFAAAAYLNTLHAQFTFDDSFAVLYNGDVTDHSKPLRALLSNDFWGQDLRSPMSHKSYRPLTILSFRIQHLVSTRLLRAGAAHAQRGEWEEEGSRSEDRGLNPLPFHACNVAAHAGVTALVFALARQLAASRRRGICADVSSTSGSTTGDGGWAADLEPFIAALLFGLHPIHTEAVAGIVGHAELLCAALSIPALLCYMAAADGRTGGDTSSPWTHWRAVCAAVLLGWAAALTKEIGITIMGAMLCYDALVAPLPPNKPPDTSPTQPAQAATQPKKQSQQPQQVPQTQQAQQPAARVPPAAAGSRAGTKSGAPAAAAVAAAATELLQLAAAAGRAGLTRNATRGGDSAGGATSAPATRDTALKRKLLRMAVAAVAVVLYVKTRSWLAGDQLVRIYRKVENPIPFSTSPLERKLTTGYLHARYAWLLLAPIHLSADWSYACIDYVSRLSDPRNLATAALYLTLLSLGLSARPWEVALEWAGRRPAAAPSQAQHERRWRLAVAAGLLVGPFFPASNVLFYVGTFIGERLLYFPSVGYCLLLAHLLAAALQPLVQCSSSSGGGGGAPDIPNSGSSCEGGTTGGSGSSCSTPSRMRRAGAVAAAVLLGGLLLFYAVRTVVRNEDWRDEERLFIAAQKVCWRSGKVQLNSGIIERRYQRWEQAEAHFRLAREVDPHGFCEPDYHIGITLLNRNLTAALEYLEAGVACKYTAADAIKALNRILMSLLERSPAHASGVMDRWAAVLARPELQRFTEAATYFETAAAKAGNPLQALMVLNRAQTKLSEARPVRLGRTPDHPVRVAASKRQLSMLTKCMLGRRPVILAMLAAGGNLTTRDVKQAAYSYLSEYGEECRGPVPLPDTPEPEDRAARTTSYHTALMHSLQEADASDPWLQVEWGLMLGAGGRHQEALVHLEVAGHIFAAQVAPAGTSASSGSRGLPSGVVLNSEGTAPISQSEAAEAAVAAYRHGKQAVEAASAAAGGRLDPAARHRVLCHLQQAECAVLQQRAALPGKQAAVAAAAAEAQRCLAELRLRGCLQAGGSEAQGGSGQAAASKLEAAAAEADEEGQQVEEGREEL